MLLIIILQKKRFVCEDLTNENENLMDISLSYDWKFI